MRFLGFLFFPAPLPHALGMMPRCHIYTKLNPLQVREELRQKQTTTKALTAWYYMVDLKPTECLTKLLN